MQNEAQLDLDEALDMQEMHKQQQAAAFVRSDIDSKSNKTSMYFNKEYSYGR